MGDLSYDDGLRDGRLDALEHMQAMQNDRIANHSQRIAMLERVAWILIGVVGFLQLGPTIQSWFL